MNGQTDAWPIFPSGTWSGTYYSLHMWSQIVGKTRLALAPMENHWWQVALYPTARGLTTSAMPAAGQTLQVSFDFVSHELVIRSSRGVDWSMKLVPQSVAQFFASYREGLRCFDVEPHLLARPVEVPVALPFAQDCEPRAYDREAAHAVWQILLRTERVLKQFRSEFLGKQSPVHFFWGSFDLAATRFSGRTAPRHPGGAPNCADWVMVEAYSRECSSCGFWPGDGEAAKPLFYAYAYPAPPKFTEQSVQPAAAHFDSSLGEYVLAYDALRNDPNPDDALIRFFRSVYRAAADLGSWDRAVLERHV
jgi:hypothetical protein